MKIPFNKPHLTGKELGYIEESLKSGNIVGNCEFTKKCERLMEEKFGAKKVLLTGSCTDAMEMASLLIDLQPDDEVIVPSFTFVSTANAFILRGARPVFVDIREDTLNIDEKKIEEKITNKTKAIYPVHYAGVSCDMDVIMDIAKKYNLYVMEDSAQGVNARYKGKFLGTIGHLGAYSFHGTKNYTCGEGGALVINDERFIERAEILREKGTNRSKFIRGEVDKYTWVDIGSSFLLSDVSASFLYAQLENLDEIKEKRKAVFDFYYENLKELEDSGYLKLPTIPKECETNYHIFYILLPSHEIRNSLMDQLKSEGIQSTFHYIPLHNSPMGMKFGYKDGDLPITETVSSCILRLPFYADLKLDELSFVVEKIKEKMLE
ncbi:TPA: dTDP-4-amino-4,6-dideoxygalactose transaminase [Candidatus Poribacteria bacterium]|nr:dTDP-4-amino-4,6-dideoxygalactose transaminase [Candidatus Poribacteria bacterium]